MNNLKFLLLIILSMFLLSCGGMENVFSNQKKNNNDEFLVKKKSPLVMPPEYGELPIPNQDIEEINTANDQIKDLIIKKENNDDSSQTSKSFQQTLLDKIKNN